MRLQLRPSLLTVRRQSVKWIIIHHTIELYKQPAAKIDNSQFQTHELLKGVLEQKTGDINYHYVVEKIKDDYYPIVTRPFVYKCDWPDISNDINNRAIHIALLGSYSFKVPPKRLYEVTAFRLINPMLKMFSISPAKIKLHHEVSNEDIDCPGDFFDKSILISMARRFIVK